MCFLGYLPRGYGRIPATPALPLLASEELELALVLRSLRRAMYDHGRCIKPADENNDRRVGECPRPSKIRLHSFARSESELTTKEPTAAPKGAKEIFAVQRTVNP